MSIREVVLLRKEIRVRTATDAEERKGWGAIKIPPWVRIRSAAQPGIFVPLHRLRGLF